MTVLCHETVTVLCREKSTRMSITAASPRTESPVIAPSSAVVTSETGLPFAWPLYRFSVGKYQELVQSGVFEEADAFELLEGLVVPKMSKNPRHDSTVDRCDRWLSRVIPATWYARIQNSLVTSDSVPEPDLAVVRGEPDDYGERHPTGTDAALVIEVAESSLANDREKARLYARAGVENYWIINVIDNQIEVFTDPLPGTGNYRTRRILLVGDEVSFDLPSGESIKLTVSSLLPKNSAT